jgi:hypothetical protein
MAWGGTCRRPIFGGRYGRETKNTHQQRRKKALQPESVQVYHGAG